MASKISASDVLTETYFFIPKDIISFEEITLDDLKILEHRDGEDVWVSRKDYEKIAEEKLIVFEHDGVNAEVFITSLSDEQRAYLRERYLIPLNEHQIAYKVILIYPRKHFTNSIYVDMLLRKHLAFSTILANRGIKLFFINYHHFEVMGSGGQGVFLPYSFLKLFETRGVNFYYQSSYDRMTDNSSWFCRIEKEEINLLKKLLSELLKKCPLSEATEEMFIHAHNISWVQPGFFYPALITLYGCFESILGETKRKTLFKSSPLLMNFWRYRTAIAHPDKFSISLKGKNYTVLNHGGRNFPLPRGAKITFNIDDLEQVRVKLIEEITKQILPEKS